MKAINIIFLSLIFLAGYATADVTGVAPEFALPGTDGEVKLSDYKGKVVYLDFWASWCSPCKDSFPWMNEMQAKYKDQGVVFIAINVERKREKADDFLKTTPADFIIAFDGKGKTPQEYDVMGMPSAFVIGKDGSVLHSHIGFHTNDLAEYETHIRQALTN